MRKLLTSPMNMALSEAENQSYQNALKYAAELRLNLMAIKVDHRPQDYPGWCAELLNLLAHRLDLALLNPAQFTPLKKLQTGLENIISVGQLKMMRIAPWPIFIGFVEQQRERHALAERLSLLHYLRDLGDCPLTQMSELDRMAFAGKHTNAHSPTHYPFDVEWFGSTQGAKTFHQRLQQAPEQFDQALAFIPKTGAVTTSDYQKFVRAYQQVFAQQMGNEPASLFPATRLLAMRRPDQFIALTVNKLEPICQGLAIAKPGKYDFDGYWHDLIATLKTCFWWQQSAPKESTPDDLSGANERCATRELTLWPVRMQLVDLFFYADATLAANSHYVRLRDKATLAPVRRVAQPRQTIESIVDNALADEDLPAYLLAKRDTIIKEVKNGKTVEQVIGLMRAIFG